MVRPAQSKESSALSMLIFPVDAAPRPRRRALRRGCAGFCKRAIDVIGASVGLVLLSPVFLLIAIAIKLDSRGPILYWQDRVGVNRRGNGAAPRPSRDQRRLNRFGRVIRVCKFRSMVVDAEDRTGPVWAKAGDSRITRTGRVLRKTRLDEFPQLWNVLKGEMSLVGPRPIVPGELSKYGACGRRLLSVRPGLTGLWQVLRHDELDYTRRVRLDMFYVAHRSLCFDLMILLRTLPSVLARRGAY